MERGLRLTGGLQRGAGFFPCTLAFTTEKINDLDYENDDDEQFENECAPAVEAVHHELIQLSRGAQLVIHQPSIVRHSNARSRNPVHTSVEHVTEKFDSGLGPFCNFCNV